MNKKTFISHINPLILKGVAHRGLHNEEFTENGLKAFKNAIDHNVALELDVHLTKDNQLIVCHDSDLKRTTGKVGIIEELTVEQIKNHYKLLDGGSVPTLQEVLDLVNEQVPILVELKTWKKNNRPLAKRAVEELQRIKDKKNIVIIAFDPRALLYFGKKGFMRSLLIAKSDYYTWHFRFFFESIDIEHVLLTDKKVMRYQRKHMVNTWTIETKEDFEKALPHIDLVTFQHLDVDFIKDNMSKKY